MEQEEITMEETVTPKEEVTKVEQETSRKPNVLITILVVLLILMLLPVLAILLFRFNTPNETGKLPVEEQEVNPIVLINPGWMKHIVPDVRLSVETPSYSDRQDIGGEKIMYTWDVKMWKDDHGEYQLFDNYVKTISAHYFPLYIPEGNGCSGGCVNENVINIHVFKNSSNLTLEKARDHLLSNLDPETARITGEIKNKWGERTYAYLLEGVAGRFQGNLVVKNGNVYQVISSLTGQGESLNIANKVLDSIRFN